MDQHAEGRHEKEEEARIRRLPDDQIELPEADEAACRRYYDNNQTKFRSPDLYEPLHILLSADALAVGTNRLRNSNDKTPE